MIPSTVRIFVCTQPQDMRRSFDRLALAARQATSCDPRDGQALFCFVNKRRDRLKVLWFDQSGCCVLYKRLHRALFELEHHDDGSTSLLIDRTRFAVLLRGVDKRKRARGQA